MRATSAHKEAAALLGASTRLVGRHGRSMPSAFGVAGGEDMGDEVLNEQLVSSRVKMMAQRDAHEAFMALRAAKNKANMKPIGKGRGPNGEFGESGEGGKKLKKWVPSIIQVGDSMGFKEAGSNFVVSSSIASRNYWCRDPARPEWPGPLKRDVHPSILLAKPVRKLHVKLEDLGEPPKSPEDKPGNPKLLWEVLYGRFEPVKEATPDMKPQGGPKQRMDAICPPVGKVHRLMLTVRGEDPRITERNELKDSEIDMVAEGQEPLPEGKDKHGLAEFAMFEAELLPPGAIPRNHGFAILGDENGNGGKRGPGSLRRMDGPFVNVGHPPVEPPIGFRAEAPFGPDDLFGILFCRPPPAASRCHQPRPGSAGAGSGRAHAPGAQRVAGRACGRSGGAARRSWSRAAAAFL